MTSNSYWLVAYSVVKTSQNKTRCQVIQWADIHCCGDWNDLIIYILPHIWLQFEILQVHTCNHQKYNWTDCKILWWRICCSYYTLYSKQHSFLFLMKWSPKCTRYMSVSQACLYRKHVCIASMSVCICVNLVYLSVHICLVFISCFQSVYVHVVYMSCIEFFSAHLNSIFRYGSYSSVYLCYRSGQECRRGTGEGTGLWHYLPSQRQDSWCTVQDDSVQPSTP